MPQIWRRRQSAVELHPYKLSLQTTCGFCCGAPATKPEFEGGFSPVRPAAGGCCLWKVEFRWALPGRDTARRNRSRVGHFEDDPNLCCSTLYGGSEQVCAFQQQGRQRKRSIIAPREGVQHSFRPDAV